jgi:hypothetical protein
MARPFSALSRSNLGTVCFANSLYERQQKPDERFLLCGFQLIAFASYFEKENNILKFSNLRILVESLNE